MLGPCVEELDAEAPVDAWRRESPWFGFLAAELVAGLRSPR
jgi:hypothetical protein